MCILVAFFRLVQMPFPHRLFLDILLFYYGSHSGLFLIYNIWGHHFRLYALERFITQWRVNSWNFWEITGKEVCNPKWGLALPETLLWLHSAGIILLCKGGQGKQSSTSFNLFFSTLRSLSFMLSFWKNIIFFSLDIAFAPIHLNTCKGVVV